MTQSTADAIARQYAQQRWALILGKLLCSKLVPLGDPFAMTFQTHAVWVLNYELLGEAIQGFEANTLYLYVDIVSGAARTLTDSNDE
jgi:hypothetical protein